MTGPATSPLNFTGVALSSTSISLSWSPPSLEDRNGIIRSYSIKSTELETNSNSSYTSVTTTLRIDSLHPYYQYKFTIAAITVSSGPFSTAITVRTQEDGKTQHFFSMHITYYFIIHKQLPVHQHRIPQLRGLHPLQSH